MNPCIIKSIVRLVSGCLSLGLLTGMMGCTKSLHETEHVEVSGKVLFKGQPLPGGRVTFAAIKGGFASFAPIDENGNYKINAPIGEVLICVENRMLQGQQLQRGTKTGPVRHLKKPDSKEEEKPIKAGRYVKIPERYSNCDTSGLTYTVTLGPQTHNIELSDNPTPPPGAAGQ